jgi:hypothetical protein
MLAGTPTGDAYTLAELQRQLEGAGFSRVSAARICLANRKVHIPL